MSNHQADDGTYIPGNRVGVLLMHGLCGSPAEMRYVAKGLAQAGYTVHCPRLGSCGAPLQAWCDNAERALRELRRECDTVVVGGHSTGALLALLLAARNPESVQGTALFAPAFWLNGWLVPWYARLFRAAFGRRLPGLGSSRGLETGGIKDERVREVVRAALLGGERVQQPMPDDTEHRRLVEAVKSELENVLQPALIVHSREDDCADIDNAWYLQRNLKGMVDMVVLDDSYHAVTIDSQRHIVVDRAMGFVEELARKSMAKAAKARPQAPSRIAAEACAA